MERKEREKREEDELGASFFLGPENDWTFYWSLVNNKPCGPRLYQPVHFTISHHLDLPSYCSESGHISVFN